MFYRNLASVVFLFKSIKCLVSDLSIKGYILTYICIIDPLKVFSSCHKG